MPNKIRLDQINLNDVTNFVRQQVEIWANSTGVTTTQSFVIQIPSGVDTRAVTFPFTYPSGEYPKISLVLSNNSGEPYLGYYLSGITNTGFSIILSNTTRTANYYADILAKL